MQVTVNRDAFIKAATVAALATVKANRATLPILSTLRIEAQGDHLGIHGTDLETAITTRVEATADTAAGAFCVDAKTLLTTVKAMPKGTILFRVEGVSLTVSTPASSVTLTCWAEEDYPQLPTEGDGTMFTVAGPAFVRHIGATAPFALQDSGRPILRAVYTRVENRVITMVAADGYMLAKASLVVTGQTGDDTVSNIPATALTLLAKIIGKQAVDVRVAVWGGGTAGFTVGDTVLYTRLVEGQYPNYRQILPKTYAATITGDAATLLAAFKQLRPLCALKDAAIVSMEPAEGGLLLTTPKSETPGASRVAATLDGDVPTVLTNAAMMVGTLAVFSGPVEIRLNKTKAAEAYCVRSVGEATIEHYLMPCSLPR